MDVVVVVAVVLTTLLVILITFFAYIRNLKRNQGTPQLDVTELEDRVLELVNRFQHISATRIASFETKIKEMTQLIKQANEYYMRLTSVISEAYKIETELLEKTRRQDVEENHRATPEKNRIREQSGVERASVEGQKSIPIEEKTVVHKIESLSLPIIDTPEEIDLKSSSIEHRILNLSSEGYDNEEIAKQLQIGRGEVQLVLELFRRKNA